MKSPGWTLTILTVTAALTALDLSDSNRANVTSITAMEQNMTKPSAVAQQLIDVAPKPGTTSDPSDEAEPELFNAFHVTAVPAGRVAAKPVVALRYD